MNPRRSPRAIRILVPAVLALAAVAVFAFVPAAFAKQSIGLSSASFDFTANAGQGGQGEVFLSNRGDETITVLIYASDQKIDKAGQATFVTPNRETTNLMDSPASWVQMKLPGNSKTFGNTPYVELKPGERIPVKFLVQIPSGAVPGDKQIMLFFELADTSGKAKGIVSKVSGRLGARIKARVAGEVTEQIDVRPFVVPQFVMADDVSYAFTVINGGNVDKRMNATISVLDRDESSRVETKALESESVYAGNSLEKKGSLSLAGLAPGQYTVRLSGKYPREGANLPQSEIVKSRSFWFVPTWLVVTVAVIVLLLLGAIVWWIAAASARRKMTRQAATAAAPPVASATQTTPPAPAAEEADDADRAAGS